MIQYNAIYDIIWYIVTWYNKHTIQYSKIWDNANEYSIIQYTTIWYDTLQLQYNAIQYNI